LAPPKKVSPRSFAGSGGASLGDMPHILGTRGTGANHHEIWVQHRLFQVFSTALTDCDHQLACCPSGARRCQSITTQSVSVRHYRLEEAILKKLTALAFGVAALLTVSLAIPLSAQTQSGTSNDKTKVYAYQKRAPATESSPAAAYPKRQVPTPSYASDEVPYGSQHWWRESERISHGGGGAE
jgi:hypothetical protein